MHQGKRALKIDQSEQILFFFFLVGNIQSDISLLQRQMMQQFPVYMSLGLLAVGLSSPDCRSH